MTSALPTLSKKRHASHDIHHQLPSIITPGKSNNVSSSKANNMQTRGRLAQNHNHQRLGNNFVLPPLENEVSQKSLNHENVNISNSYSSGFNNDFLDKRIVSNPEKEDGYLDSRYSDNGDELSDDSQRTEDDDEGGEVFDADPAEFGVTITKL